MELAAAVSANVALIIKVGKEKPADGEVSASVAMERLHKAINTRADEGGNVAIHADELSAMMLGARANHTYEYDTEGASTMLINLAFMIDIATCECSVPSDLEREMATIRSSVGVDAINSVSRGALRGARAAASLGLREVDAAACGELEPLDALR